MRKKYMVAMFIAGAAVGTIAAWYYAKKKYEKIAEEEINSVKEVFAKKETDGIRRAAEQAKDKPDIAEYAAVLQKTGYGAVSEKEENAEDKGNPYIIAPEKFGEIEGYDQIDLTYYADGILADDDDEVVENVESLIGDALEHFGEYEDDAVFVRSDRLRCDYEIVLDKRKFSDISSGPSIFK